MQYCIPYLSHNLKFSNSSNSELEYLIALITFNAFSCSSLDDCQKSQEVIEGLGSL